MVLDSQIRLFSTEAAFNCRFNQSCLLLVRLADLRQKGPAPPRKGAPKDCFLPTHPRDAVFNTISILIISTGGPLSYTGENSRKHASLRHPEVAHALSDRFLGPVGDDSRHDAPAASGSDLESGGAFIKGAESGLEL